MAKYEALPNSPLGSKLIALRSKNVPELVHMNDPALLVMTDFYQSSPLKIDEDESMDSALDKMKVKGEHLLLVINTSNDIVGVLGSEDILGEKPIKILQEHRIQREQILVKRIMVPLTEINAFDINIIEKSKVGNIVETLKTLHKHYALVIQESDSEDHPVLRGIFTTSHISRKLHVDIADLVGM